MRIPSIAAVPSFQTMDQLHYLATGEHMSPISGDVCPHPTEYYILMTQRKQQRRRAYDMLFEAARGGGGAPVPVKSGEVNGTRYDHVVGGNGYIVLYNGPRPVMTLWPTGEEGPEETPPRSEAASPARAFCLRPPPSLVAAIPPIPEEEGHDAVAAAPAAAPPSRLRKHYWRFLAECSDDCLAEELLEWREELARAAEHVRAIEEEQGRRRGGDDPVGR